MIPLFSNAICMKQPNVNWMHETNSIIHLSYKFMPTLSKHLQHLKQKKTEQNQDNPEQNEIIWFLSI